MKSKVYWHQFGYLPGWFGFCPDERAWKREMRRMNCVEPYTTTDARMTTFTKDGKLAMIVTVAHHIDDKDIRTPSSGCWCMKPFTCFSRYVRTSASEHRLLRWKPTPSSTSA